MQKFKNFLLKLLSTVGTPIVIEIMDTIGESELEKVLQDLHDSNIDDYKATIAGGNALVQHLKPLIAKTTNVIDDAFIHDLQDALEKSMTKNGITL